MATPFKESRQGHRSPSSCAISTHGPPHEEGGHEEGGHEDCHEGCGHEEGHESKEGEHDRKRIAGQDLCLFGPQGEDNWWPDQREADQDKNGRIVSKAASLRAKKA